MLENAFENLSHAAVTFLRLKPCSQYGYGAGRYRFCVRCAVHLEETVYGRERPGYLLEEAVQIQRKVQRLKEVAGAAKDVNQKKGGAAH